VRADLDSAILELEDAARELRSDDIDSDRAAALVDRCAEIAATIGSELDRIARESERDAPDSGQERLL
jgi:hypothetical protein